MRAQGRHPASPALWVTPGKLPLWFYSMGLQGNLWGFTPGNLIVMEKWVGACNNQHSDLCRLSSYLQCPSKCQNQHLHPSVEPKQWSRMTRKLGRVKVCLIQVLKSTASPRIWSGPQRDFLALKPVLQLFPDRETSLWSCPLLNTAFSLPDHWTYLQYIESCRAHPAALCTVELEQRA